MGKVKALFAVVSVAAIIAVFLAALRHRNEPPPQSARPQQDRLAVAGSAERARDVRPAVADQTRPVARDRFGKATGPAPRLDMADGASPLPDRVPTAQPARFSAELQSADRLAADGQVLAAHRALSTLYREGNLGQRQKAELLRRLEPVARDAFFGPGEPNLEPPYVLQPGDLLVRVARKWNVSWQYLERLNGIDARRIRAGQRLKVVRGPFEAVVDLSDFELTVYLNGLWVRTYRVGTGRNDKTPVGAFTVLNKVENPEYDGPEGHFTPDDPQNPVGEHWIALGHGYGIHGTIEPQSIGKQESLGCIRMLPEDVEEVYHLLVRGSKVTIQR
jgi:hypothetical protein